MAETLSIVVEFTGGLEMLFANQRKHTLTIPATDNTGGVANVGFLIEWLCDNAMTDSRKDVFVLDGTVRPGILVLINDADWELEGQEKYELQPRDNIVFVSTLHGG